jgi:CRP/FNR family cyclic AMP-dependent transcriptional regulator
MLGNLKQVSLFKDFTEKEIGTISQLIAEKKIPAGTPIYVERMIGDGLYIVKEGSIRILKDIPGVGERQLLVMKEGDFFGELALIDPGPRVVSAKTVEDSVLMILEEDKFRKLADKEPVVFNKLVTSVIKLFINRVRQNAKEVNDFIAWQMKEKPGR